MSPCMRPVEGLCTGPTFTRVATSAELEALDQAAIEYAARHGLVHEFST